MAAPPGGDRRGPRGGRRGRRLPHPVRTADLPPRPLTQPRRYPGPVTPSPVPVESPEFIRLPVGPNGIIGQTTPWEDSLRLPVSGAQPAWFWPATGRSETIGGLPADDSGYQFTRVGGGWAVQANGTFCGGGDCATPPSPVWFLGNGAPSATPVGTADLVAPADDADALWLTSYFPTANDATAGGHGAGGQHHRRSAWAVGQPSARLMSSTRNRPRPAADLGQRASRGSRSTRSGTRPRPRPAGPSTT